MIKIGLRERIIRSFKAIFSSSYRLIDTTNQVYENKHYDSRNQNFFEIARKYQEIHGVSQQTAVNRIHDSFVVKDYLEKKKTRQGKEITEILESWYQEQDDFDLGIDLIYDFYE